MKKFRDFILCIFTAIMILLVSVVGFGVRINRTSGMSMWPALQHGDTFITYDSSDYKLGDIVIFRHGDIVLVKRIIGTPNASVKIENGQVFINEKLINEPYLLNEITSGMHSVKLGKNQYFVLGDNRVSSRDSRSFGPIRKSDIIGEVIFRFRSLSP